jgi:hypothetical protein
MLPLVCQLNFSFRHKIYHIYCEVVFTINQLELTRTISDIYTSIKRVIGSEPNV